MKANIISPMERARSNGITVLGLVSECILYTKSINGCAQPKAIKMLQTRCQRAAKEPKTKPILC